MSIVSCRVKSIRPEYNNLEEWFKNPDNVYIGRHGRIFIGGGKPANRRLFHYQSSIWHNPFSIKDYGLDRCLELYEQYIREKIEVDPETYDLLSLKGKCLGCWCKPNRCHGDILLSLIDEKKFEL